MRVRKGPGGSTAAPPPRQRRLQCCGVPTDVLMSSDRGRALSLRIGGSGGGRATPGNVLDCFPRLPDQPTAQQQRHSRGFWQSLPRSLEPTSTKPESSCYVWLLLTGHCTRQTG